MKPVFIILFLLLPALLSASQQIHLGKFSSGELSGWNDKIFKGRTRYTIVSEEGRSFLFARSSGTASGLIKQVKVDPARYPILKWSWKVNRLVRKEDLTRKGGDDFAARVYVVFPRSFWRMRAISYVWASKAPRGSSHPNPYTDNAMVVAVESGNDKLGKWIDEERNIYEDYRKLFGEEPPEIGAVALMTDTDDTREDVTACYGDIFLVSR